MLADVTSAVEVVSNLLNNPGDVMKDGLRSFISWLADTLKAAATQAVMGVIGGFADIFRALFDWIPSALESIAKTAVRNTVSAIGEITGISAVADRLAGPSTVAPASFGPVTPGVASDRIAVDLTLPGVNQPFQLEGSRSTIRDLQREVSRKKATMSTNKPRGAL